MVTIVKISDSVSGVVTRRKATEYLLGTPLTTYQWMCVQQDWKAFADNPLKYADTAVVDMVNWCFSFGIPVFIMGVIGLWWKRSTKASVITFIITWIVVCIWSTFGLQNALGWANFHVNYISLIVALIVGVISTAVLPGKKGLFAGKRA